MKVAFSVWDNRIAPVFDVARQIEVVEIESERIKRRVEDLECDLPAQKASRLVELGIGTLVCGAISRPLQAMFAANGLKVIPFIAGNLTEVIQAWSEGNLEQDLFAMPGCCRRGRRRFRGNCAMNQEELTMKKRNRGGRGTGGGQGRGQSGQGLGRMGGSFAAGPDGACVCPQCGYQEAHQRGTPCMQKQCPQCGIPMSKQ
jgi:predicted Fe-Mo cluster-binding NifX family protein